MHPWIERAEGEGSSGSPRRGSIVGFDDFFEEEHERLFKALYFVTGNSSRLTFVTGKALLSAM